MKQTSVSLLTLSLLLPLAGAAADLPNGWQTEAPRDEIRPKFAFEPSGGPSHTGSFVVMHDQRDGLDGWFQKTFPVSGGRTYRFDVVRKTTHVDVSRRSALARIVWHDDQGHKVHADVPKELTEVAMAEAEYPSDGATDAEGWTEVSGVYRAPEKATQAVVELHLQWAPSGNVEWSNVRFEEAPERPARKVRLVTVHYKPTGKSPRENCEEYAPFLARAAMEKADLVVLGETVPAMFVGRKLSDLAEAVPGPTTEYFGKIARDDNFYVVLSLYERDRHLIYNTAVLIGPDGSVVGKYHKSCLPPDEAADGVAPGNDYPVFDTRFGKVGMMVCYDGFFPEVARELSNHGAEVIAWPVWGCNPLLGQARACENHVYVVSSTYMQPDQGWMVSAIFDQTGTPIARADKWGTIAVAEVDLNQPHIGPYNLGDFRAMLPRQRPAGDMSSHP
jgi:predicted amidohydrolase